MIVCHPLGWCFIADFMRETANLPGLGLKLEVNFALPPSFALNKLSRLQEKAETTGQERVLSDCRNYLVVRLEQSKIRVGLEIEPIKTRHLREWIHNPRDPFEHS
jgi:hypothetical protein